MIDKMTSSRPYLLRSLNEWIHDNNMTPHIVVDATQQDVIVPTEFVTAGKIVLNVSGNAINGLAIDNDFMSFSARFSGKPMDVIVPISAVMAIYAKENGQGMVFTDEVTGKSGQTNVSTPSVTKQKVNERPSLKLVQ